MSRMVVLITGANRGLGFELSRALLRIGGYHVLAAARSWQRGRAGGPADHLSAAYESARTMPTRHEGGLSFLELDVASHASRYALGSAIADALGAEPRLNAVVNNAGVYVDGWSADVHTRTLATNALGPLRLTEQLMPFFASGAQVVNVTSGYGKLSHLPEKWAEKVRRCASIDDLERELKFEEDAAMASAFMPAYKLSKAALNRGTQILAEKNAGKLRVNCVDPGWCSTDMGGARAPRTPADGARSIFSVLVGDASVIKSGNFFAPDGTRTGF